MEIGSDARRLIEAGRRLRRASGWSGPGSPVGQAERAARAECIEFAMESIAAHPGLTREQKERGLRALKRARERL